MRYYLGLVMSGLAGGPKMDVLRQNYQRPQNPYLEILNIVELNELDVRKGS